MKIDDLIEELEEVRGEHGNIDVMLSRDPGDEMSVRVGGGPEDGSHFAVVGLTGGYGRGG